MANKIQNTSIGFHLGVFENTIAKENLPDALNEDTIHDVTEKAFVKACNRSTPTSTADTTLNPGDSFYQSVSTIKRRQTKARTKALLEMSYNIIDNKTKPIKGREKKKSKNITSKNKRKPKVVFSSDEDVEFTVQNDKMNDIDPKVLPRREGKNRVQTKEESKHKRNPKVVFSSDEDVEFTVENCKMEDIERKVLPRRQAKNRAQTICSATLRESQSESSEDKENLDLQQFSKLLNSDIGLSYSTLFPEIDSSKTSVESSKASDAYVPDSEDEIEVKPSSNDSDSVIVPDSAEDSFTENNEMPDEIHLGENIAIAVKHIEEVQSNNKKSKLKKVIQSGVEFSDSDENEDNISKSSSLQTITKKKSNVDVNDLTGRLSTVLSLGKPKRKVRLPPSGHNRLVDTSNDPIPGSTYVTSIGPYDLPGCVSNSKKRVTRKVKNRKIPKKQKMKALNESFTSPDESDNGFNDGSKHVFNSTRLPTASDVGLRGLDISVIAPIMDCRRKNIVETKKRLCPMECSVTIDNMKLDSLKNSHSADDNSLEQSPIYHSINNTESGENAQEENYSSEGTVDYSHHEDGLADDSWSDDEGAQKNGRCEHQSEKLPSESPVTNNFSLQVSLTDSQTQEMSSSNQELEYPLPPSMTPSSPFNSAGTQLESLRSEKLPSESPLTTNFSLQVSLNDSQTQDMSSDQDLEYPLPPSTTSSSLFHSTGNLLESHRSEKLRSESPLTTNISLQASLNDSQTEDMSSSDQVLEYPLPSSKTPSYPFNSTGTLESHRAMQVSLSSNDTSQRSDEESLSFIRSPVIKLDVEFANTTSSSIVVSDVSLLSPFARSKQNPRNVSIQASLSPPYGSTDDDYLADSLTDSAATVETKHHLSSWRKPSKSPLSHSPVQPDPISDSDEFESCNENLSLQSDSLSKSAVIESPHNSSHVKDKPSICEESNGDAKHYSGTAFGSPHIQTRDYSSDESSDALEEFFNKMKVTKEKEQTSSSDEHSHSLDDFVVSDGKMSGSCSSTEDEMFHVKVDRMLPTTAETVSGESDDCDDHLTTSDTDRRPKKPARTPSKNLNIVDLSSDSDEDIFIPPRSHKKSAIQSNELSWNSDEDFRTSMATPATKVTSENKCPIRNNVFATPKMVPPKPKCVTVGPARIVHTPRNPQASFMTPSHKGVRTYFASHDTSHYSFLHSLSTAVTHEHRRDPEAAKFIKHFKKLREELCSKVFKMLNETVFNEKLPVELKVLWNSRLYKTAGYCAYKKDPSQPEGRSVRVELSNKVCDTAERVRDTLAHELCHAVVWYVHGKNDGHGPYWKLWAQKVNTVHSDIPVISRCHTYSIATKYIYKCSKCGYEIGRHSKSLDTSKKLCGYCRSPFQLMVCNGKGNTKTPATPKAPNKFALFVKDNYGSVKKDNRKLSHKEIMGQLSIEFALKNKI